MKSNTENLTKRHVEKNSIKAANTEKKTEKRKNGDERGDEDKSKDKNNLKYGPLPKFPHQRVWARGILIFGVLIYVWYFSQKKPKETVLAKQKELYELRGQNIPCSSEFSDDIKQYAGCIPKSCGRYVSDKIITTHEVDALLQLARRVMALGGSKGGASIMDLHSGALSFEDKFINVYAQRNSVLTPTDLAVYKLIRSKIQNAVATTFGLDADSLFLTHPTFFSRMTNLKPVTPHDEYWHPHIDKHTYEAFHYTSLLYLNDYSIDFKGGRFIFMDDISNPTANVTIQPRKGRVSMFTSGPENPHFVERVTEGTRFAITVSFTCDPKMAIEDPVVVHTEI